jgi:predicted RNA-binding Zn-ribbon protein involved in translation (DUF1610 family)
LLVQGAEVCAYVPCPNFGRAEHNAGDPPAEGESMKTAHDLTEADVRRRALGYGCPTCGRAAGVRCAMLGADGTHTAAHRAPTNCHPERNMVAWRVMLRELV